MLEVHPPHEPVHSFKDFLLHIAVIVIGLLIAVGLEQTVEHFHHRHQAAEARKALNAEIWKNQQIFKLQTEEFHRFAPSLLEDQVVLEYLRDHPHAPPSQWPGKLDFRGFFFSYDDNAWKRAQQSGVLDHMPPEEASRFGDIYSYTQLLTARQAEYIDSLYQLRAAFLSRTDATALTADEAAAASQRVAQALTSLTRNGRAQQTLSTAYPMFNPAPTPQEVESLLGMEGSSGPAGDQAIAKIRRRIREIENVEALPEPK